MPSLISLTEKGHFLFRFNSMDDRDCLVNQSPLIMDKKNSFSLGPQGRMKVLGRQDSTQRNSISLLK